MIMALCLQGVQCRATETLMSPDVLCYEDADASAFAQQLGHKRNGLVKAGKGDLPIYNLYGPVKRCVEEVEGDEQESYDRAFDKNGRLVSEDGDKLNVLFPGGVNQRQSKIKDMLFSLHKICNCCIKIGYTQK